MGVKLPQAKGLLKPPKADEAERSLSSQSFQRDDGPADTLILNKLVVICRAALAN